MTILTLVASADLQDTTAPLPAHPAVNLIPVAAFTGWCDRDDAMRHPGIRPVKGAKSQ